MAWCKLEDSFRTNRKFKRLARALGIRRAEARGLLSGLWSWCLTNAVDGNLAGMDPDEIEDAMDWEGEPGAAFGACVAEDILLVDKNENGEFEVHEWMERSGSYKRAKQKKKERDEKRRAGNVALLSRDSSATVARLSHSRGEEKRGKEKKREELILVPDEAIARPRPAVYEMPLKTKKDGLFAITEEMVAEYAESFPGVNVDIEFRKLVQWCRDNPTKCKTRSGARAFISRWMGKAQDRGPQNLRQPTYRANKKDAAMIEAIEGAEQFRGAFEDD